jgi:hypothetical protein
MHLEKCVSQEQVAFDREQHQSLSSYEEEIETITIRVVGKAMQEETKRTPEPIQSKKVAKQRGKGSLRNRPADPDSMHSVCDPFFALKGSTQNWN